MICLPQCEYRDYGTVCLVRRLYPSLSGLSCHSNASGLLQRRCCDQFGVLPPQYHTNLPQERVGRKGLLQKRITYFQESLM